MTDSKQRIGLTAATLMVAGNIMGSGVFMLPANLAATGGIAIYGWIVTILGAVSLSLVYAKMSAADDSPGGSYAYAKKAFGPFIGYQTNLLYWFGNWIGNVAIAVVGVGYLSYFFPILKETLASEIACIAVLWLFTYINILGPNLTTRVQSCTTIFALVAIVGVALLGWLRFDLNLYLASWNVHNVNDFSAIQSVLNVTLWSFIGVETASVAAGVVENPKKNVPIATIGGVLIAAVCYVLSCTAIMGVIPGPVLAKSAAPFADAARIALGEAGGAMVSFCATLGCLGSLGGWILATALTAKAAAADGLFPKVFADSNSDGTPVKGLMIVATLMSLVALGSIAPSASKEFGTVSSIAVLMTLVPYVYVSSALLSLGKLNKQTILLIAFAIVYCAWALLGSNHSEGDWLAVFLLISTALYQFQFRGKLT
ncbi:MAG: arginine/agmatine antiporter [Myxococcaceae bacterium]|nr:arginine/agmatine antiporter [Myxococcaceae bacterium]MBH2006010.1 arginine/agmatine antiporter [Myxococcaceae bacterium]